MGQKTIYTAMYKGREVSIEEIDAIRNELNGTIEILSKKQEELSELQKKIEKQQVVSLDIARRIEQDKKDAELYVEGIKDVINREYEQKKAEFEVKFKEYQDYEPIYLKKKEELHNKQTKIDLWETDLTARVKEFNQEKTGFYAFLAEQDKKSDKEQEELLVKSEELTRKIQELQQNELNQAQREQNIQSKEQSMLKHIEKYDKLHNDYLKLKEIVETKEKIVNDREIVINEKEILLKNKENDLKMKENILADKEYNLNLREAEIKMEKKRVILWDKQYKANLPT